MIKVWSEVKSHCLLACYVSLVPWNIYTDKTIGNSMKKFSHSKTHVWLALDFMVPFIIDINSMMAFNENFTQINLGMDTTIWKKYIQSGYNLTLFLNTHKLSEAVNCWFIFQGLVTHVQNIGGGHENKWAKLYFKYQVMVSNYEIIWLVALMNRLSPKKLSFILKADVH